MCILTNGHSMMAKRLSCNLQQQRLSTPSIDMQVLHIPVQLESLWLLTRPILPMWHQLFRVLLQLFSHHLLTWYLQLWSINLMLPWIQFFWAHLIILCQSSRASSNMPRIVLAFMMQLDMKTAFVPMVTGLIFSILLMTLLYIASASLRATLYIWSRMRYDGGTLNQNLTSASGLMTTLVCQVAPHNLTLRLTHLQISGSASRRNFTMVDMQGCMVHESLQESCLLAMTLNGVTFARRMVGMFPCQMAISQYLMILVLFDNCNVDYVGTILCSPKPERNHVPSLQ